MSDNASPYRLTESGVWSLRVSRARVVTECTRRHADALAVLARVDAGESVRVGGRLVVESAHVTVRAHRPSEHRVSVSAFDAMADQLVAGIARVDASRTVERQDARRSVWSHLVHRSAA